MDLDISNIKDILRNLHAARNDPSKRYYLLESLVLLGEGVVIRLVSALDSPNMEIRSGAASALGRMYTYSDDKYDTTVAVPALLKCTEDDESWVSFHSASSLWMVFKNEFDCDLCREDIIGRIVACLDCDDPQVRVATAYELRWKRSYADIIVPSLIDRLNDPAVEVRLAVAESIASFGANASDAIPTFMEWVHTGTPEEMFVANNAVIRIDEAYEKALGPMLIELFPRLKKSFQVTAVHLMGTIVEYDGEAVALLARYYNESDDRELRYTIIEVLTSHGLATIGTETVLLKAIHDEDPEIAYAAGCGLATLKSVPLETLAARTRL